MDNNASQHFRYPSLIEIDKDFLYQEILLAIGKAELANENMIDFILSYEIIGAAMGRAYMGNFIDDGVKIKANAKDYFRGVNTFRSIALRGLLARALWRIRGIKNLNVWLKEKSQQDPETFIHEVDTAAFYHQYADKVILVKNLKKKKTYDFEILVKEKSYCVEAKVKLETTNCSPKAIADTLEIASEQIPEDREGIVSLYLPPKWFNDKGQPELALKVLENELLQNHRIKGVFIRGVFSQEISENSQKIFNRTLFYTLDDNLGDIFSGINFEKGKPLAEIIFQESTDILIDKIKIDLGKKA